MLKHIFRIIPCLKKGTYRHETCLWHWQTQNINAVCWHPPSAKQDGIANTLQRGSPHLDDSRQFHLADVQWVVRHLFAERSLIGDRVCRSQRCDGRDVSKRKGQDAPDCTLKEFCVKPERTRRSVRCVKRWLTVRCLKLTWRLHSVRHASEVTCLNANAVYWPSNPSTRPRCCNVTTETKGPAVLFCSGECHSSLEIGHESLLPNP
jgi:hypothetical protein